MAEDMFPNAEIPADALDAIAVDEIRGRWPRALAEMSDVAEAALREAGVDRPDAVAMLVLGALARLFGGRQFYFPQGKAWDIVVRDRAIWHAYNGKPEQIDALAAEHGLTTIAVYRIIATQRALRSGQAKLF